MGIASDLLGNEELTEGNAATRALLATYAQTPRQGMTPMRTPQRTPAGKQDAIMMEAENQRRLTQSQTPLLGGDNPMLHPSDFSGVTPKKRDIATPNPLLTPSATPGATPGATGLTPRIGMTPSRDAFAPGTTPRGTPMRDELHINEDMDMHDSGKLRPSDLRKELLSGLKKLPQPKNDYQIVIQPFPEEDEEPEEKIEEDMSDRIAREKAEEEARQQALLKKRSKVLQRELPRPPPASLDLIRNTLMRADEDKSSFVPPTLVEQADELIRKELLSLLEHDNAKYPLDKKAIKEPKKGGKRAANGKSTTVPSIDDFEEDELKEADELIKDEVQHLRIAMGHENESVDGYVEAHNTCLNDIMYFPTRDGYGLSSVANNTEKITALQNEFENVKNKMDEETKKAQRLEQKIKLLTNGYQMRGNKLWTQIEATFKQMDTAGTELECFQALKKQEQIAATHRISNLWEEVQKQKDLERTLQKKYGDLTTQLENLQNAYRLQAEREEAVAAKNNDVAMAEANPSENQSVEQNLETPTEEAGPKDNVGEVKSAENQDIEPGLETQGEDMGPKDTDVTMDEVKAAENENESVEPNLETPSVELGPKGTDEVKAVEPNLGTPSEELRPEENELTAMDEIKAGEDPPSKEAKPKDNELTATDEVNAGEAKEAGPEDNKLTTDEVKVTENQSEPNLETSKEEAEAKGDVDQTAENAGKQEVDDQPRSEDTASAAVGEA